MKQAHFYILFSIVHISISVYSYISNIKYRYQKHFFLLYFLGSTYHYSLSNILYIYIHVSFSAQPSKFHYVIGGQLHNEIQSAHILETSMSAKEVACGINVHVTFLCRLDLLLELWKLD